MDRKIFSITLPAGNQITEQYEDEIYNITISHNFINFTSHSFLSSETLMESKEKIEKNTL